MGPSLNFSNYKGLILVLGLSLISACDGKKAYYVARSLLGYIEPPKPLSVGEQMNMEFERCKKSGGDHCEQQALEYVRIKNKSLRRKPNKGRVIITEGDKEEQDEQNSERAKETDKH